MAEQKQLTKEQQQAVAKARARLRLREQQAEQQEGPRQPQAGDFGIEPFGSGTAGFGEGIAGLGEGVLSTVTGGLSTIPAGFGGMIQGVYNIVRGDVDDEMSAAERVETIQQGLTFQPRTKEGQEITKDIQEEVTSVFPRGRTAGEFVTEKTGLPSLGAATETLISFAPGLLGAKRLGAGVSRKQRIADVKEAEQIAREEGVNLKGSPQEQLGQVRAAAERKTEGASAKGETLTKTLRSVEAARLRAKRNAQKQYREARAEKAGVPRQEVVNLPDTIQESLKAYDVADMPKLQKRLGELNDLVEQAPEGSSIKLNALEDWRKRLNRNRPPKTDEAQNAAINIAKAQYDNFIETQFNADMIKGSQQAVTKWKKARKAWERYKEIFDESRTIKQFRDYSATPEEIKNWVFGSSAVGGKRIAGRTVKRLKEILGEESQGINSLRTEAYLDITEPLLSDTPNFFRFAKNYDNFVKNNPTLAKELFTERQLKQLRQLRTTAKSVKGRSPGAEPIDIQRAVAVGAVGHGIAKRALAVRLATKAARMMLGRQGAPGRKDLLRDIVGYDIDEPMIPKKAVVPGSTIEGIREQQEQ